MVDAALLVALYHAEWWHREAYTAPWGSVPGEVSPPDPSDGW